MMMQVANIPIVQATANQQQPSHTAQTTAEGTQNFLQTLNAKINEQADQTANTAPTQDQISEDELLTEQAIQIMVVPSMLPLMQAFIEQPQAKQAVTGVETTLVSSNIEKVEPPLQQQTGQELEFQQGIINPEQGISLETAEAVSTPVDTRVDQTLNADQPDVDLKKETDTSKKSLENETKLSDAPLRATQEGSQEVNTTRVEPKLTETEPTLEQKPEQKLEQVPEQQTEQKLEQQLKQVTTQTTKAPMQEAPVAPKAQIEQTGTEIEQTNQTLDAEIDVVQPGKQTSSSAENQANTEQGEEQSTKSDTSEVESTLVELGARKNLFKINDSSAKLDVNQIQSPQTQLVDTIKQNLIQGRTEFEMQLTPIDLGKITVKMVAENGNLTVEFIAENPKTQQLLLSNASEIRELIQGSTTGQTQVITPNNSEGLPQNYTQQEKQNNQQENQQQNPQSQQEQSENAEPSTVDFLSILQQLKEQVRLTRV